MLIWFRFAAFGSEAVSHVESSSACGALPNGAMATPEMPFTSMHWSKIGRSDSSAGGGELRKLSGVFGQN